MPVAFLIYFCPYFFLLLFFFFFFFFCSVCVLVFFAFVCLFFLSFLVLFFVTPLHSLHILTLHLCVCMVYVYMSTCLKTEFKKNGSGWRKDVVNQCLKFGPVLHAVHSVSHLQLGPAQSVTNGELPTS